jgi:aspartyl/asparaginyl beta-hydroxylase (cupin superfamily)
MQIPPRFIQYIEMLASEPNRLVMQQYPGLKRQAFHQAANLPLARALEANSRKISHEFRQLNASDFHPEAEAIGRVGDWDVVFLLEAGRRNESVLRHCPTTAELLEEHGVIQGLAGLTYFSRLGPMSRVSPHRGSTNLRLRCHLGITIPDGTGLRVGDETRHWSEGRCIVFDDTFVHEAWNSSMQDRIVLVSDVWHPELTEDEVSLLQGLHNYALTYARGVDRYLAQNDGTRHDGRRDRLSPRPGSRLGRF